MRLLTKWNIEKNTTIQTDRAKEKRLRIGMEVNGLGLRTYSEGKKQQKQKQKNKKRAKLVPSAAKAYT